MVEHVIAAVSMMDHGQPTKIQLHRGCTIDAHCGARYVSHKHEAL